jgi:hypothetical protein
MLVGEVQGQRNALLPLDTSEAGTVHRPTVLLLECP